MDPSRNNMPLQFNGNNNNQHFEHHISDGKDGMYNEPDDVSSSTNQGMMTMGDNGNLGGDQNMMGVFNMMGPMVGPMPADPNMMMMGHMNFNNFGGMMGPGPMGGMGPMDGPGMMGGMGPMDGPGMMGVGPGMMGQPYPIKEVITLKSSVLYPAPIGAPLRSTRERPPGCRTIFVGGIPDNTTEEILCEVFENCGPIQNIRISKKNFSHIRFDTIDCVDRALYISGYRMKISDSDDHGNTGRLHVDFAQARDDQYEFECQQRAYAREMRHIQRLEEERHRPPSPDPVPQYSMHEGAELMEKLKSDECFMKASQSLVTWLDKGEIRRQCATQFFTMIKNVHGHVRRLTGERLTLAAELEQYKVQYQQRLLGIRTQLCQVERVIQAAHKQKCWDHFTKAQRKSIDTWQRQAQEARDADIPDEIKGNSEDSDDMDCSDDEAGPSPKKVKAGTQHIHANPERLREESLRFAAANAAANSAANFESHNLKDENDTLKCQMEAFKNEVDLVRQEGRQLVEQKEKQLKALQNALQGMQQQLIASRAAAAAAASTAAAAKAAASTAAAAKAAACTASTSAAKASDDAAALSPGTEKTDNKDDEKEKEEESQEDEEPGTSSRTNAVSSSGLSLSEKEAKMIGLICCFLHVHPHGATVDYLWSYLRQLVPNVRTREVEDLLEKVPVLFQQEIRGVGAGIERRWIFSALSRSSPANSTAETDNDFYVNQNIYSVL